MAPALFLPSVCLSDFPWATDFLGVRTRLLIPSR